MKKKTGSIIGIRGLEASIKVEHLSPFFPLCVLLALMLFSISCKQQGQESTLNKTSELSASDILGNPDFQAISYSGYRTNTRDLQPTISQIKNDLRILSAIGIRVLRTYNTHYPHAGNVLKAIRDLRKENRDFEMYVMLGAWINCKGAFTANPDHTKEDSIANAVEIERAVTLANEYPEIVKILAVGNEAMVKWAASYYVEPGVILRWVRHLQELKKTGGLPGELWITSSDNFASWGGGDGRYHVTDLDTLISEVDYVSLHTYPMHDTHYNPNFWGLMDEEMKMEDAQKIEKAMQRALEYAQEQFRLVAEYVERIDSLKPIHIGETGWASFSNELYGDEGSKATDGYKSGLYYKLMRDWTNRENISCFYFEAFDETWKDSGNPGGSENHFGLFTIDGKAKYVVWDFVDKGAFAGLMRDTNEVIKTYGGDIDALLKSVEIPEPIPILEMAE